MPKENKISHDWRGRASRRDERLESRKTGAYAGQWLVTVLISSIDWIGFECAVKDDQEFSHRGG